MQPAVSVVVTAHNEEQGIAACLGALADEVDRCPGGMEIVLVDDRSHDRTGEIAAGLEIAALRILRIDDREHAELSARQVALDRGIRAARGEVVLLLDADAAPAPHWSVHMIELLEETGADAVAGAVWFRPERRPLARLETVDMTYRLSAGRLLASLGLPSGAVFGNFAFRRERYLALGGFSALGPSLVEDREFCHALQKAGGKVVYDPVPRVSVKACRGLREFLRQRQRAGSAPASAGSLLLRGWALLLPLLFVVALVWPLWGWPLFGLRYAVGALVVGNALARARQSRLTGYGFVYEPIALALGAAVFISSRRRRRIHWGGLDYVRSTEWR